METALTMQHTIKLDKWTEMKFSVYNFQFLLWNSEFLSDDYVFSWSHLAGRPTIQTNSLNSSQLLRFGADTELKHLKLKTRWIHIPLPIALRAPTSQPFCSEDLFSCLAVTCKSFTCLRLVTFVTMPCVVVGEIWDAAVENRFMTRDDASVISTLPSSGLTLNPAADWRTKCYSITTAANSAQRKCPFLKKSIYFIIK